MRRSVGRQVGRQAGTCVWVWDGTVRYIHSTQHLHASHDWGMGWESLTNWAGRVSRTAPWGGIILPPLAAARQCVGHVQVPSPRGLSRDELDMTTLRIVFRGGRRKRRVLSSAVPRYDGGAGASWRVEEPAG